MQPKEKAPGVVYSTCDFPAPPLEGLATARGSSWALPARTAADASPLPPEAMVVLARGASANGGSLLLVACEARADAALVAGSRQWVAQVEADGRVTWSARVGLQEGDGRREWWERARVGWSTRVPGAVELTGGYEDATATTSVRGRATAWVAPGPDGELAPDPACPYVRPLRGDTSRRLLVLDDVRVRDPAVDTREARLRMTLSGGPSYRVDERWNWPKGTPEFGKLVEQAREETFSRRAEWQGELGGWVHVCPSSLPPAARRG